MKTNVIAKTASVLRPALAGLGLSLSAVAAVPTLRAADACCSQSPVTAQAAAEAAAGRSVYQLDSSWTDDAGRPFTLADLRGRPVVLAMFFTSCGYACPRIVADMVRIRATLPVAVRDQTRFVLVSFDDARDSVEVLHAYRRQHELDSTSWILLRGAPDDIRELAAVLGLKYLRNAAGMFEHSNLITVLNGAGEIVHQRAGLDGGIAEAAGAVAGVRPAVGG